MNLLDVADGQPIAYGGYFVMEIYEQNGKYYTEVLYWIFPFINISHIL